LSCPVQTNYATLKAGARVVGYSSVHGQKTQDTLDNLLRQTKVRATRIRNYTTHMTY
jgi:hypothetical protein